MNAYEQIKAIRQQFPADSEEERILGAMITLMDHLNVEALADGRCFVHGRVDTAALVTLGLADEAALGA